MLEKEFVPYEEALELKDLGFDEPCLKTISTFQRDVNMPLYQQAFRWFREKHKIECHIKSLYEQRINQGYYFGLDDYTNRDFYSKPYYSYEEAELACLRKLIEIVKGERA